MAQNLIAQASDETKWMFDDSTPIMNNAHILQHMVDQQMAAFEADEKCLSQTLIDELTTLFGKSNRRMRLEFLNHIWVLDYEGLRFNVFTAKHKGTSIEIANCSLEEMRTRKHEKGIIAFLDELHRLVNTV